MKPLHIILLPVWFIASFVLVGGSITLVNHLSKPSEVVALAQEAPPEQEKPVPAISTGTGKEDVKGITTNAETDDARAAIVADFLERHAAPLEPNDYFGEFLVSLADEYGIDYRLLPAIAMQESNICKKIPPGSFNCLGFGVHSGGTLHFESYEANFEAAARSLKKNYIDIGLNTPEKIMTKYTPHSNGSWANSVNQWIAEMEFNDRQLGREMKKDADLTEYVLEE